MLFTTPVFTTVQNRRKMGYITDLKATNSSSVYVSTWSDQHENDTYNKHELVSNQFCSSQHNVNLETYPIEVTRGKILSHPRKEE